MIKNKLECAGITPAIPKFNTYQRGGVALMNAEAAAPFDNAALKTAASPVIAGEATTARFCGMESAPAGIKVTVRIPENVPESARRQKINKIYDILSKVPV